MPPHDIAATLIWITMPPLRFIDDADIFLRLLRHFAICFHSYALYTLFCRFHDIDDYLADAAAIFFICRLRH